MRRRSLPPDPPNPASAWYLRGLIRAAEAQGLSRDGLLERAGIGGATRAAPRAPVGLRELTRLYSAVADRLDDEMLGLLSRPARRGAMDILVRAGATTRTVSECAEIVARTLSAVVPDLAASVENGDSGMRIAFRERARIRGDRLFAYAVVLHATYGILCWLAAARLPLARIDYPFPAPAHEDELRALIPGAPRFGAARAALCFEPGVADLPIARDFREIPTFVRQTPGGMIEGRLERGALADRVRRMLLEAMPRVLTVREAARRLAVSVRTLHRHLQAEDASFQSVKDGVRRELAVHALTCTDAPIKQIALDVGFADQATFQRAFAFWTGVPPAAYRQSRRAGRPAGR